MGIRHQLLYFDAQERRLWLAIWGMIVEFPEAERMHALSYALSDAFDTVLQEYLAANLAAGDVFIDVGASVGVFACIGARMVGPTGMVLAYEPLGELAAATARNVARNAPYTPFHMHTAAAGAAGGRMTLHYYPEDSRISTAWAYGAMASEPRDVEVRTLDADVPERPVRLVKIDAEGAELHVLRGMEAAVARSPNIGIILEWSPTHFERAGYNGDEILSWAAERGFTPAGLDGAAFDPAANANIVLTR